jgi:hypothetical protein
MDRMVRTQCTLIVSVTVLTSTLATNLCPLLFALAKAAETRFLALFPG